MTSRLLLLTGPATGEVAAVFRAADDAYAATKALAGRWPWR